MEIENSMKKRRKMRRKGEPRNPLPPVSIQDKKRYQRSSPKYDYFKYLKVVRYHIKRKYGLNWNDMELLLFLYSEGLFTRKDFKEFTEIYSWDRLRFEKLRKSGFIHKWREHRGKQAALYEITEKTRQIITDFYNKLAYEVPIAETARRNPIFGTGANFTDKVYQRAIRRMNREVKDRKNSA